MLLNWPTSPEGLRLGRALFLGPTGSGKTTMAAAFVTELQWPKELIRCVAPPTKPKLARTVGVTHIGVDIEDRQAQEDVFAAIFNTVTTPYDEGGHDIGLIIDDSDFYFSSAGRTYATSSLQKLVKLGREAGLGQVFIAQGSSAISKDLISNSNTVFFFRTTEPNLLDYAGRYMPDVPDAQYLIGNLDPYTALIYAPNETPKLRGFAKVEGGVIQWKELPESPEELEEEMNDDEEEPEPPPSGRPSPSTMPERAPTTPDASADSPGASGP